MFSPKLVETLERILKKGKRVYVEGSHRTRKWIDKEGREQRITEVIVRFQGKVLVLDNKSSDSEHESSQNYHMEETENNNNTLEDDVIPF